MQFYATHEYDIIPLWFFLRTNEYSEKLQIIITTP